MMRRIVLALVLLALPASAQTQRGYYRFPALHGDAVIFTAEGDLWRVGTQGGVAQRLTSHPGTELYAAISPDGATIAFTAEYEGPTELYTMPTGGGLPTRHTFDGRDAQLEAAVKHLQELIAKDPRPVPPAPKYPDKRFPK